MSTRQATRSVFISHSAEDKELARDIARRLRAAGLDPIQVAPRADRAEFRKALKAAARKADAAVFLLTPSALDSEWTIHELGLVDGSDKEWIPVTAGLGGRELPVPFRGCQTVPFDQVDQAIQQLVQRLNGVSQE